MRKRLMLLAWGIVLMVVSTPSRADAQDPPPPVGEVPAVATAAAPAEPAGRRLSWTGDRTLLKAGDLVTVLIDEYTLATADMDDTRTRDRNRNLGIAAGSTANMGASTVNTDRDRTRADTYRRDRLAAEVTARVVEVAADGSLRLEGQRLLRIDNHDQTLTVRGWVRPGDVGTGNTVASLRLADAEILYETNGKLGGSRSLLGRLLDRVWP